MSAQTDWFDSNVTQVEYTFICDTPAITAGGTFTDSVNVSISSGTSSASIYYTTDGGTHNGRYVVQRPLHAGAKQCGEGDVFPQQL
ncbi:MAG: chitobiase/beta-hexosaminidase C-terminal domain-containing protein [Anaerolineae bacterium]